MPFYPTAFLSNGQFTGEPKILPDFKKFRKYITQRYGEIVTMEGLYEISEYFSDFSCQLGIHNIYLCLVSLKHTNKFLHFCRKYAMHN